MKYEKALASITGMLGGEEIIYSAWSKAYMVENQLLAWEPEGAIAVTATRVVFAGDNFGGNNARGAVIDIARLRSATVAVGLQTAVHLIDDRFAYQFGTSSHEITTYLMDLIRAHMPVQATAVPAGWFPDPQGKAAQRYWDGAMWTEHTA